QRRLRQANLFGPAGFVSADDGEVIEMSQQGFAQDPDGRTISALGGHGVEDTDHMVTETLIRGMVAYWRRVMEVWSWARRDRLPARRPRAEASRCAPTMRWPWRGCTPTMRRRWTRRATRTGSRCSRPIAATWCSRARTTTAACRCRQWRSRGRACCAIACTRC